MTKIAIIYYSMHGHIESLAKAEKRGVEKAGGTVDMYQIPETLPDEVLGKMRAATKDPQVPVLDSPRKLLEYDGFLLGIPTRFGNMPNQWKAFWDSTIGIWATFSLTGKKAGVFVSSGTIGGGQESTILATMSALAHHGIMYVPLGYAKARSVVGDSVHNGDIHGGGPWGAGTFSGLDGSRKPSAKEIEMATLQGEAFYAALQPR